MKEKEIITEKRMSNAKFAKTNKHFLDWCELNKKEPTTRMASKYRKIFQPITHQRSNDKLSIPHFEQAGLSNHDPSEEVFHSRSSR
ncbi:hypothetical protein M0R19_04800 [Candidatus Pacearchaeota archaeon]|jgi:hypothetical protein|nr:hypothetical protein [Candidatus Pacearchaeota archaeon]